MINESITEKLRSIYQSMPKIMLPDKGSGWVNQNDFQREIKNARINYKNIGYERFNEFLADSGIFFLWTDYTGEKPTKYVIEKAKPRTQNEHRSQRIPTPTIDSEEVINIKRRLRLENNFFIGQFAPDRTDGWYKISDIRNTDFTKIEDKERGVKDLTISFRSANKYNRFAYYKFTWVLLETHPLKFGIDLREDITPISPEDIVTCLHDSIVHYPASAAKKITRTLDTLNKQLTQSGKEVFIYELLQNANDYPRKRRVDGKLVPVPVDVDFHITSDFLTFQHTGDYFNPKNIAAICDINDGEKSDNVEAIGYKGIGFKTVFLDNDYVYLNTGSYSLRFDKFATDVIDTPWQILPVWTDGRDVHAIIRDVFSQHDNDLFRVKFALQPRDKRILTDKSRKDNYIDLFSDVFDTERVILFIPNIRKVCVYFNNVSTPVIIREKDNSNWCVSPALTGKISDDIRERINDVLTNQEVDKSDGYDKIPEKYLNFHKTAIRFACKKEGRKLIPVDDAILYCYLPAKKAEWGFKFLMNTDMVPNGPRDDIEDIELNHEICKIAGRQFFYWIKSLISSGEYELDSVFNLIPDFDECKKKKHYKAFIEEFQEEFESLIVEEEFVPVVDTNGNRSYACIDDIVNDMTGFTEKEVMDDKYFLSLLDKTNCKLPIQELRASESFMSFLYKHSPSELDIKIDHIKKACTNENFQTWLKDIEHNTRFIEHLLDSSELEGFAKKSIFIEYEGGLFVASDLYYDYDTNCSDIDFLKKFVPNLCEQTRLKFSHNEEWTSFVDNHFMDFDASTMISDYIVDNEDAIELLKIADYSVAFFKFVADNEVDLGNDKEKIPYINGDNEASTDYDGLQYFYDEDVYNLSKAEWLGDNTINVLSHIYLDDENAESIKAVFEGLRFADFDQQAFIQNIVAGDDDFCSVVNEVITDDIDLNKSFVSYVFEHRESLKEKDKMFANYVLYCNDIEGDEVYLCNDDLRYFDFTSYAGNSTFADNKNHNWLETDMMYSLNNCYFDNVAVEEKKNLESFLRQSFGIRTFTDKSFFADVVIKNRTAIYPKLQTEENVLPFISYLKRDAGHIFHDSLSFNDIKDIPLLCSDGTVISSRDTSVRLLEHNEDAIKLYDKDWCPVVFNVLSEEYSNGFTKETLQLFKIEQYDLNSVLTDILGSDSLVDDLENKDNNIDFWQWIKANQKSITDLDSLIALSLLDSDDNICACENLYISDVYQKDGIESLVKKYDSEASFVSDEYLADKSDSEKTEWVKLFKKLGLKSDNKDILFNSVLPNLSTFSEDSVISMMTKHLKDLKSAWKTKKEEIKQLRVRTKSGEYKTIDQTLIISIPDEQVSEPFKYIELSGEIDSDILENNKELILLIAKEFGDQNILTSKQGWAEEKVAEYIDNIQDDEDKRDICHIDFVRELAKLSVDYKISSELISQIKFKAKGNKPSAVAQSLTLSSSYSPICDFESNGITELPYLSECYIFEGNRDIIKSFFKSIGVHHTITTDDLMYLSNRAFACYFWSYCFSRRLSEYKGWVEDGKFSDIACVPTETGVKKPGKLYFPWMVIYAAKSRGWKERVPFKAVVDKIENRDAREVFNKLPFNPTLSFEDCLYYLLNAQDKREDERSRRETIVNWMLEAEDIDDSLVKSYRQNPNALWRNGKGQKKHISELYVIHPEASQQKTIFSGDEHIMITNMFPSDTDEFERLCGILQVKYLKSSDFVSTPINQEDETEGMMKILKPRLLVLAAIEDADNYKDIYERYNEIISKYKFIVCDKIDLGYDTIHNDVERIYNDDAHIYYVNSWLHNRTYTKFCGKLKKLLSISLYDNVCEEVLDGNTSVEHSIEKFCFSLAYNEEFRAYLNNLDCSITVEEEETVAPSEENYYTDALSTELPAEEEPSDSTAENNEDNTIPEDANKDYELISQDDYELDDLEATGQKINTPHEDDFIRATIERIMLDGVEDEVVCEHYRIGTWVRGHWRNGYWVNGYWRNGSNVSSHTRNSNHPGQYSSSSTSGSAHSSSMEGMKVPRKPVPEEPAETNKEPTNTTGNTEGNDRGASSHRSGASSLSSEKAPKIDELAKPHSSGSNTTESAPKLRQPQEHRSFYGGNYEAREWTKEDVERIKSKSVARCLSEGDAEPIEIEQLNTLFGSTMTAEEIADTNYLAQMRLYQNLIDNGYEPDECMEDFVKSKNKEHNLTSGKYIHKCSAKYGIVYISPSIWNKVERGNCIICVYLDKRAKDFMYLRSIEDILTWIHEDDILIKLTGEEKADVVKTLYNGVLEGVSATVYTMIRVASNAIYNPVFAQLMDDPDQIDTVDDF